MVGRRASQQRCKPVADKRKVAIPYSERSWVRVPVACEMLGDVAISTIYEMKGRGLLESRKVGGIRLFSVASINKLIDGEAA
jgi:hypothetical protein